MFLGVTIIMKIHSSMFLSVNYDQIYTELFVKSVEHFYVLNVDHNKNAQFYVLECNNQNENTQLYVLECKL